MPEAAEVQGHSVESALNWFVPAGVMAAVHQRSNVIAKNFAPTEAVWIAEAEPAAMASTLEPEYSAGARVVMRPNFVVVKWVAR